MAESVPEIFLGKQEKMCIIELQNRCEENTVRLAEAYDTQQLEKIEQLYLEAFPASERKPFAMLLEKRDAGLMEVLAVEEEDGSFAGLAIVMLHRDIALFDYFAIAPQKRGTGIGSEILKMLQQRYADRRFLLEIEDTALPVEDRQIRIRRKGFYLRNSMTPLPMIVNLFGVQMEVLSYRCEVSYDEYHAVYEAIFGPEMGRRVTLVREEKNP